MTGFLADTCALIAYHGRGPRQLRAGGLGVMRSGEVHVSPISLWEIERNVSLGRIPAFAPSSLRGGPAAFLRLLGYVSAPLTWDDAAAAAILPYHHRDPMDRCLIATALRMDLTIVTSDRVFQSYGVRTIW